MNDVQIPATSLFGQLYQKLEAIEGKQDEQNDTIQEARLAMARMEERQVAIYQQLASGANRTDGHNNRIESLEKSRDKVNTILGMIAAAWTTLLAFGAWLWQNMPLRWKG